MTSFYSSHQQKPWSPPKPSYNSPKPTSTSSPYSMNPSQKYSTKGRDPYLISMERLQNWTFERSSMFVCESKLAKEKYSIHCSPKSNHSSLLPALEDENISFSSSTSFTSHQSNEQSIFEGWEEDQNKSSQEYSNLSNSSNGHERKLSDRTQQLISSTNKKLQSSTKKLFTMSNRTMADVSEGVLQNQDDKSRDSLFEELVEESFSEPFIHQRRRSSAKPSIPRRRSSATSLLTTSETLFLPSSYASSNLCEMPCQDSNNNRRRCSSQDDDGKLFGLGLKGTDLPAKESTTILAFDPLRRPRQPFPSNNSEFCSPKREEISFIGLKKQQQQIPRKAAKLLGTISIPSATPNTFSQESKSESILHSNLSPCPDRMNGLGPIFRPKPEIPSKSSIRPPLRPARPTEEDIFADMDQIVRTDVVEKPIRRKLITSKPLPAPQIPLPKLPKKSSSRKSQLPQTKSNTTSDLYAAYSKFEANLIGVQGDLDLSFSKRENVQIQLQVGGMNFSTDLNNLCPKDVSVSQFGLCSWLEEQIEKIEKEKEKTKRKEEQQQRLRSFRRRRSSSESSYFSDDDFSNGVSTVENSPSVRTPSLYEYASLPLPFRQQQQQQRKEDQSVHHHREDHESIPKSVSCESQLSVKEHKLEEKQRNTFGVGMIVRRSSSCGNLQALQQQQKRKQSNEITLLQSDLVDSRDSDDGTSRYSFGSSTFDQSTYKSQFDSILGRQSACLTPTESSKKLNNKEEQIEIPTFVFAPSPLKLSSKDVVVKTPKVVKKNKKMNTTSNKKPLQFFITLPINRNPMCFQIILHLLQFGQLPQYFKQSTLSYQQELLLEDVRQECFWLGYTHLVNIF